MSTPDLTAQLCTLLARPGALPPGDAGHLAALLAVQPGGDLSWLPEAVPGRETKAQLLSWLLQHPGDAAVERAASYVDTATDVLRVLVVRSGGTGSLADRPRLATVPRPLRRTLLALLDRHPVALLVQDMLRHRRAWLAAGEKLHPGTYAARYPNAALAFATIRGTDPRAQPQSPGRRAADGAATAYVGVMTETMLHVNGVELCVGTFGSPGDPAILLIDGAAASMLWFEAGLCERLAAGGRFVIRYDQRDTGRSTAYPPGKPDYSNSDLARDAVGILDALGIGRAHVVCRSMSGGTGLILGVDHPERVATLTFVSTSTGGEGLPPSTVGHLEPTGDPVEDTVAAVRAYAGGSPYFDEAATRDLVQRDAARAKDITTAANHYSMRFEPPSGGGFGDLRAPALVVHGDLDPLLPLPHGEAVRDAIPGARLVVLPGAGHDLPPQLWETFAVELLRHTGNQGAGGGV